MFKIPKDFSNTFIVFRFQFKHEKGKMFYYFNMRVWNGNISVQ